MSTDVRADRLAGLSSAGVLALFGITMGLSAALLFAIQPMYAKMLLPLVGGAPSVWNTVVVFFQVALLCGYLFAHGLRSALPLRVQVGVFLVLAGLALALLPFRVGDARADGIAHPVPFVLATLLAGTALPFLVISLTSPLLQSWYACLGQQRSGDPYFLYSASNAGSLLGLAAYPLLIEPLFGVSVQTRIWEWTYLAFIGCLCACGAAAWYLGKTATPGETVDPALGEAPTGSRRARWIALAFVPASLSLAMTTHITNEVAPIPLLWTLPLGIYLLTFIIAFAPHPALTPRRISRLLPYAILLVVLMSLLGGTLPYGLDILLDLAALFLIALTCHGELAASRPQTRNMTEFYALLAVGGALGGLFNAIVAPNVFHNVAEYPLTIVLACAILPVLGSIGGSVKDRILDVAVPIVLACVLFVVFQFTAHSGSVAAVMTAGYAGSMVACFALVGRRLRFAFAIAALFTMSSLLPIVNGYRVDAERNFFGMKVVLADARTGWHALVHSGTQHGLQDTTPAHRRNPLSYYANAGPLGSVFQVARAGRPRSIGVVGLGIGSIACYRRAGERWTFFEIDPQVVAIAQNRALFSFLPSCAADANIVVGDGRLELARVPEKAYDLLVLDAYSSDQPPTHMLTREAFELYMRRLADGGLIAFHISNRYFNLAPIVANLAADAGWPAWIDNDLALTPARRAEGQSPSQWVVIAKDEGAVRSLAHDPRWQRLTADRRLRTWSDDYSSLLLVMHL